MADPRWVGLDCQHTRPGSSQRNSQSPRTRTYLDYQLIRLDLDGSKEAADLRSVNQEVLAERAPSSIARSPPALGGHGPSPSQS
jgi:hypothetical protein